MVYSHGIALKKKHGQHFLRQQSVADTIVDAVHLDSSSHVFEIGPGDGFLTRTILHKPIKLLWAFEIDSEWAKHLNVTIHDKRLTVFNEDFLHVDFSRFELPKQWVLLANLPYNITFPILHLLVKHTSLIKEGVIMIQEEVAEKLLKTHGRGYGFASLYFQHYFEWKKLDKIPPSAFVPPPKIFSRLLYFKPRHTLEQIPDEQGFWHFIKIAFRQPRRTLRNNLEQTHVDIYKLPQEVLQLRAQQMNKDDLLKVWNLIRPE